LDVGDEVAVLFPLHFVLITELDLLVMSNLELFLQLHHPPLRLSQDRLNFKVVVLLLVELAGQIVYF